jgi:uncharacterized membrane protein YqjE
MTAQVRKVGAVLLVAGAAAYAVWRLTKGRRHDTLYSEVQSLKHDLSASYSIYRRFVP